MQSPKRTIDLRFVNRQTTLRHLYFGGSMSRLELSQQSGLSPATVGNVINELMKENIVIETGLVESEGGRPRTMLAVNPHLGYFVGIDLGETHVQLELFDLNLHKQNTVRYLVSPEDNTPQQYVEYIVAGLDELCEPTKLNQDMILGVGIGVPGVVERTGTYLVASPIWKWITVALWDLLKARISLPIVMDNGAKAMTLAESWFGRGRGVQNLITILVGTGIGAGIITEGNLYRGLTNSAGEFGHTVISFEGRPCRCGSNGCLEAYAGAPGIITTLRELAPNSPLLEINDHSANELAIISNIVRAAEQHDPIALETLRITARYLGVGIANLVNLFNPELIVVGGWAGLQIGESILVDLRQYLKRYALPLSRNVAQIDLCRLGQDAICMGAACLVLDKFLSENTQFTRKGDA